MNEEMNPLLLSVINLVAKVGIDASIALLESKMVTQDDALAALKVAREKSLAQYIAQDAARRTVIGGVGSAGGSGGITGP